MLENVKQEIKEVTVCPVNWESIFPETGLMVVLTEYWCEFVEAYEINMESSLFENLSLEIEEDIEALQRFKWVDHIAC